jgi:hypothetical protein
MNSVEVNHYGEGVSYRDSDRRGFRNPIVILTLLLVVATIGLIGAAVLGIDKGVLANMADREHARGLITFLFAVVTIGTALVLTVSALIGSGDDVSDKQFQRGKEVFSLLLGVFGTIVGYYFGATIPGASAPPLRVSSLEVLPSTAAPGAIVTARALIAGGVSPYHYTITFGDERPEKSMNVSEAGLIAEQVAIPRLPAGKSVPVQLAVTDAHGRGAQVTASVKIASR